MTQDRFRQDRSPAAGRSPRPGRWRRPLLLVLLVSCAGVAFAVHAGKAAKPSPAQAIPQPPGRLQGRLTLQPAADRIRRRLGQRFLAPGREVSAIAGTLIVGTQRHAVQVVRSQEPAGEQVTLALDGGPPALTWSAAEGALSAGRAAAGAERSLIERVALDSPDQFVLAQLRGAGYFNVAFAVRPADAGDAEDYAGPLWDLVRIGEPKNATNYPQSAWRVYSINTATGLIDKIASEEQGEVVEAQLSEWVSRDGEMTPARIQWRRAGQIVMELNLDSVAYGPKH